MSKTFQELLIASLSSYLPGFDPGDERFRREVLNPLSEYFGEDLPGTSARKLLLARLAESAPDLDGTVYADLFGKPTEAILSALLREQAAMRARRAVSATAALTSDDLRDQFSVFQVEPRQGSFSTGTARAYFSSPRSLALDPSLQISLTLAGRTRVYRPTRPATFTLQQVRNSKEGSLYYVDFPITATVASPEYDLAAGELQGAVGIPGAVRIDNPRPIRSGSVSDSPELLRSRIQFALRRRGLSTVGGIGAILPELGIIAHRLVRGGDPLMVRDRLYGPLAISGVPGGFASSNPQGSQVPLGEFVSLGIAYDIWVKPSARASASFTLDNIVDEGGLEVMTGSGASVDFIPGSPAVLQLTTQFLSLTDVVGVPGMFREETGPLRPILSDGTFLLQLSRLYTTTNQRESFRITDVDSAGAFLEAEWDGVTVFSPGDRFRVLRQVRAYEDAEITRDYLPATGPYPSAVLGNQTGLGFAVLGSVSVADDDLSLLGIVQHMADGLEALSAFTLVTGTVVAVGPQLRWRLTVQRASGSWATPAWQAAVPEIGILTTQGGWVVLSSDTAQYTSEGPVLYHPVQPYLCLPLTGIRSFDVDGEEVIEQGSPAHVLFGTDRADIVSGSPVPKSYNVVSAPDEVPMATIERLEISDAVTGTPSGVYAYPRHPLYAEFLEASSAPPASKVVKMRVHLLGPQTFALGDTLITPRGAPVPRLVPLHWKADGAVSVSAGDPLTDRVALTGVMSLQYGSAVAPGPRNVRAGDVLHFLTTEGEQYMLPIASVDGTEVRVATPDIPTGRSGYALIYQGASRESLLAEGRGPEGTYSVDIWLREDFENQSYTPGEAPLYGTQAEIDPRGIISQGFDLFSPVPGQEFSLREQGTLALQGEYLGDSQWTRNRSLVVHGVPMEEVRRLQERLSEDSVEAVAPIATTGLAKSFAPAFVVCAFAFDAENLSAEAAAEAVEQEIYRSIQDQRIELSDLKDALYSAGADFVVSGRIFVLRQNHLRQWESFATRGSVSALDIGFFRLSAVTCTRLRRRARGETLDELDPSSWAEEPVTLRGGGFDAD